MLSQAHRIEHGPVQHLVTSPRNPRTHSDSQIAAIEASIRQYGLNAPVVVDNPGHRPRRGARRED